MGKAELSIIPN